MGSIPDGVFVIVRVLYLSGRTVALRSTQTLTEMSTRDLPWARLTILPLSCEDFLIIL
jgi:hypothetical protein